MKRINKLWLALMVLLAVGSARASLDIPDGNPIGVVSTIGVGGLGTIGSDITVTLNITGGNNGDLYAYLSYNGQLVTLLDRPGVTSLDPLGETDPGYSSVVLSDGAYGNIDNASGGGSAVSGTYNAAGGASALSVYTGGGSDGTWTLFIADLSGGDPSGTDSQLVSWYLTINGTTVPEPVTWALIVFALGALALTLGRRIRLKHTA